VSGEGRIEIYPNLGKRSGLGIIRETVGAKLIIRFAFASRAVAILPKID
jgi:hypothetical protein